MKHYKLFLSAMLLLALLFSGYQCSSTELTSAKLYIQQKNYDKAKEVLQEEISKNPASDEGYYLMGYVEGELGNYTEMVENYEQSLQISDKFKKDIQDSRKYFWANAFNKGVTFFQRGNNSTDKDSANISYDKSIEHFTAAVMIEPDSGDAHRNLAFVYMSKGDNEAAVEPLENLIALNQELDGYRYLGEIYYVMGTNLKSQGKTEEAKEYFDKAIEVLEQGREIYPNNSDLLVVLSNSYIGADKIDVAIDAFKSGVAAEPENKFYRYNYGVLLLGAEDFEGAETQFLKAIEIDPDYENAIYNLGVTYVKWGAKLNKLADEKGELSEDYKEKYQMSLPYLEKSVEMNDKDAETWELLGRVYSVLGMQQDATNAFDKADKIRKGQ